MFDYTKLKQRIEEKGFSYMTLANKLNIRVSAFENKINNFISFTYSEIEKIVNILDIPVDKINEYFFTQKV